MNIENIGSHQVIRPKLTTGATHYQESTEYEKYSTEKQRQRERILALILANSTDYIKYIGLPGKTWLFENELLLNSPESDVTGVEKNPKIYHSTKWNMPARNVRQDRVIDKSKAITDSIKLDINVNRRTVYILGDLLHLTDIKMHSLLSSVSGTFSFGMTDITAVWYDFTSSFNEHTFKTIYNVVNIIKPASTIPACFTLMYGRDLYFNGKGEESRVGIIEAAIPEFDAVDVWTYNGYNRAVMINIFGLIKNT